MFCIRQMSLSAITLVLALGAASQAMASCGKSEFCRVSGVEGRVDDNRLNAHILPGRDSKVKFGLYEGDEVRNMGCEQQRGLRWCKVAKPENRYEFGWVLDSYLRPADGGGGYGSSQGGGTSIEFKRGYNDAIKGGGFDNDRHPQDYKDGYRAGEEAKNGGTGQQRPPKDVYAINRLSNGNFEIVWEQRGCIATANRQGEILSFNDRCTDDLTERSRHIARRER